MAWFLGIDGGGTKTTGVVGDETRVLGTAQAGGSNIVRVGETQARRNLHAAIEQACAAARVTPARVASTCVGVAGVSAAGVPEKVHRMVTEIVSGKVAVVGDMDIAMEAAFSEGPGVIVVAGTGSIAYGRNQRGDTARAGGWGYAISDEGSAHWVGRTAVSACLRAYDAGQKTALLPQLMEAWDAATREDLVRVANASPPPNFAELFAHVLAMAESGDALAAEVLTEAGLQLARLAGLVLNRLWPSGGPLQVGMAGGVFEHGAMVRRAFLTSLRTAQPEVAVLPDTIDPAAGALELARKALKHGGEKLNGR